MLENAGCGKMTSSAGRKGQGDEMKISDARCQTICGPQGVIVSSEGVPEGGEVPIEGFVAGVDTDEWQYVFVALSVLEEWSFQGQRLKATLDSCNSLAGRHQARYRRKSLPRIAESLTTAQLE
jgi:hypothetical protein